MGMGWVTQPSNQMCNTWKPASLQRRQLKLVIENPIINGMGMSVLAFALFLMC
jgi:hypothetical protein